MTLAQLFTYQDFKEFIKPRGSQSYIAKKLNVNPSLISKWKKEKRIPLKHQIGLGRLLLKRRRAA